MEQSPLTLQERPETFEAKIVQLYRELFQDPDEYDKAEGFWRELFLLRPDLVQLKSLLDQSEPDYLLHINHICHDLLQRCVSTLKEARSPSDEHALQTLSTFMNSVLSKRYQSPSTDLIEILAGLDNVDHVFQDLVEALDTTIRQGRTASIKEEAVRVVLSITSGAFQTSLLTYFTQRDLFPSLMTFAMGSDSAQSAALPITLIGVLANCNKFEIYNPYQSRIAQLSDNDALDRIAESIAQTFAKLRDSYVVLQDDSVKPWSIGGTLSYVGLGPLAGRKTPPIPPSEEVARMKFAELPASEAAILLSIYEFVVHNKQFTHQMIKNSGTAGSDAFGFAELCSFTTYLIQHAYRSTRAALYSHLALTIMRIVVEDPTTNKRLFETLGNPRLCRQRLPTLPLTKGDRPLTAAVLDVAMDAINHNLRTNLDVNLYFSALGILLRSVSYLCKSRSRLSYHWNELWRCLLSFIRFCSQYHEALRGIDGANIIVYDTVNLITLCLTQGEAFLPDPAAIDDLFYKVIESHSELEGLQTKYELEKSPVSANIKTLMDASLHFTDAFDKAGGRAKSISTKDVMKVIKDGYETLSIEAREGTDHWTQYREQDCKTEIKKITRIAVADARLLAVPQAGPFGSQSI
ncbi:hypothetical protein ANO11243_032400 [Dothideomycetidae sp. 11243]|nr:hypothetical protein ANO11243_032400 [fungal sp. No.11243]